MNIFIAIIGYLAGFCGVISFIPQAIKTIKSKNTKVISLKTYITYAIAQFFFLLFGILSIVIPVMHPANVSYTKIIIWGFTLILPYTVTIIAVSCIIFIKLQNIRKFGESANKLDFQTENNLKVEVSNNDAI